MTTPNLLEERFFKLSVDLLCVAGMDGFFKRLNPAWEQTLGFTVDELLAQPIVSFIHPADVARTRELSAPLMRGVDVVQFENRYLCKDGSYRWISWACGAYREGDPLLYAIGRDVTSQHQSEERLIRKTSELEAIFKALPDLLFRIDEVGRIVDYSAGRAADLYVPPETFLGKKMAEILPSPLGDQFDVAVERAHRLDRVESVDYDLAVPAGQQRFEARFVPMRDRHTVVVARNVTDTWNARTALHASEERLRQSEKLEATGRLAGGIAHDFNNLMMVVLLHSEALMRKADLKSYNRELLDIHGAGERAADLTRQLLAFARKQILSPTVLDPGVVVRDTERMLQRLIGENIMLTSDCPPGIWNVRADRSQLEQVVLNLVLNARDAMPRGGRVTIALANIELGDAEARQLELAAGAQYVRIAVTDTGEGIAPEALPHIFEPFFTTKGVGHGTGLGLATVYGIVHQSGGAITVESTPNHGASFRILLPRAEEQRTTALVTARSEPRGTETILIVEDEAAVRRVLVESLRQLGYKTVEAASAEAALELGKTYGDPLHLLLTDVLMPGITGYELATQLLASRPTMQVVYMSGYSLVPQPASWPPGQILSKPFQLHELARSVREALETE